MVVLMWIVLGLGCLYGVLWIASKIVNHLKAKKKGNQHGANDSCRDMPDSGVNPDKKD